MVTSAGSHASLARCTRLNSDGSHRSSVPEHGYHLLLRVPVRRLQEFEHDRLEVLEIFVGRPRRRPLGIHPVGTLVGTLVGTPFGAPTRVRRRLP